MKNVKASLSLILSLSCLALVACNESEKTDLPRNAEPTTSLQTITQPIYGGTVDNGDMAVVGLYDSDPMGMGIKCTGVLIHPNWVLTSAKCVTSEVFNNIPQTDVNNLKILVGKTESNATLYAIAGPEYVFWPDSYKTNDSKGDIALIKLKTSISRENVVPILPHPRWLMLKNNNFPINVDVVGYGIDPSDSHYGIINSSIGLNNSGTKRKATRQYDTYCGKGDPSNSTQGCSKSNVREYGCRVGADCSNPNLNAGITDQTVTLKIPYGAMAITKSTSQIDSVNAFGLDVGRPSIYTIGGQRYVTGILVDSSPFHQKGWNIDTAVMDYYDWIISHAPEIRTQYKEICGNGIDDDGNGKTDDDDAACKACPNGIINVNEDCDGTKFREDKTTCAAWYPEKWSGGNVSCNDDCTLNTDACQPKKFCGDGEIIAPEECDGTVFPNNSASCADFSDSYTSGNLNCTSECKIDTSNCVSAPICGDGKVNGDEICDGDKFKNNRKACNTLFPELYESGQVTCKPNCQEFDTSACVKWCGNGSLNNNKDTHEVCDGDKFGNKTCETEVGMGSTGTLVCSDNCLQIDTTNCSKPSNCGNGRINADENEECDGEVFPDDKVNCADYDGYIKGTVTCNKNCTINYDTCEAGPKCGDGVVGDNEVCDGTNFKDNQVYCKNLFPDQYKSGKVTCNSDCTYNVSECVSYCGDGTVSSTKGEACDHGMTDKFPTNKNTCEKVVGPGSAGKLHCSTDCKTIEIDECTPTEYCGDGIVNGNENCDGDQFRDGKTECSAWDSRYGEGNVICTKNCYLQFSCELKPVCGDGKLTGEEPCDGTLFKNDRSLCKLLDSSQYQGGRVTCTSDCKLDWSTCQTTVTTPDEICDNEIDDDGNGQTDCADEACASDATCRQKLCGNGTVDYGEECDTNAFYDDEDNCSEWMLSYKSGKVTCNQDCTVNYEKCSVNEAEICDNKQDDNGDGRIDCDDFQCKDFKGCEADTDPNAGTDDPDEPGTDNPDQPGTDNPDQPGTDTPTDNDDSNKKKSSGDSCSAMPLSNTGVPMGAWLLGLLGLGALVRRRQRG